MNGKRYGHLLLLATCVLAFVVRAEASTTLWPDVETYLDARRSEINAIPDERKRALKKLALYIGSRARAGQPARITFICTHNSRRSHMAQIWAEAASTAAGVDVETFSGGTEATAFNPRAVAALRRAGARIEAEPAGKNPVYEVRLGPTAKPIRAWSKVYTDPPNPKEDFVAVMTCTQADKNCPTVSGASMRIAIPYEDPKAFDGTERESDAYDDRARQIAREMLYVFSLVRGDD